MRILDKHWPWQFLAAALFIGGLAAIRFALKGVNEDFGWGFGLGLMIGIEFVRDRVTKEPSKQMAADVEQMACKKGMMLLTCGPNGIRLVPPLIITREQCTIALEILDSVITEAEVKNKIG